MNAWFALCPSVFHFPMAARGLGIQGPADMTLRPVACVRRVIPHESSEQAASADSHLRSPYLFFFFQRTLRTTGDSTTKRLHNFHRPSTPEKASFHLREMNKPFLFWRADQWRPRLGTAGGAVWGTAGGGLIWGWLFVFSLNKACRAGAVAAGASGKPICR